MNEGSEKTFTYTYSSSVNKEVKEIREKYLPKEKDKLDELRALDRKIQTSGMSVSLTFGISGVLIFGIAMCMALDVIAGGLLFGAIIGIIGAIGMFLAYPVYITVSKRTRAELVPKLLRLADEISAEKIQH